MSSSTILAGSPGGTGAGSPSYYSMGLRTYRVPLDLHATNRAKLLAVLRSHLGLGPGACANVVVYLEGGFSETRHATDHEPMFRQESYFHYLFGVREPDVRGCVELDTGRATLFIPKLPEEYVTVMGRIKSREEVRDEYGVDDVRYVEDVEAHLLEVVGRGTTRTKNTTGAFDDAKDEKKDGRILLLSGLNSDSGQTSAAPILPKSLQPYADPTSDLLHNILAECRVIKSSHELQLMRHVTELTSLAHAYTMARTEPRMAEFQSESLFRHYAYYSFGARHLGYTAICGCGPSGAVVS